MSSPDLKDWLDKWPSTPVKLITAWAMSVLFFLASLFVMLTNREVNEAIFYTLAAALFGADVTTVAQFIGKRKTAWAPPATTASEVVKPATDGQPAKPAPVAVPPSPPTGAPGGMETGEDD